MLEEVKKKGLLTLNVSQRAGIFRSVLYVWLCIDIARKEFDKG